MSEERINPQLMGIFAIALSILSIAIWIIHYFITIDAVIIIAVIFPCTIFGMILALSHDPKSTGKSIHRLQKIGFGFHWLFNFKSNNIRKNFKGFHNFRDT